MQIEKFNIILKKRLSSIESVLAFKAKEYATQDRLHNFKVAARINNTTPAKALWGMALKHLVSITDIIERPIDFDPEIIDEKIGDMINYLILLEAILKE